MFADFREMHVTTQALNSTKLGVTGQTYLFCVKHCETLPLNTRNTLNKREKRIN